MMKIGKMIFIKRFFILPLMLGVVMFPSMVVADNGCENEDNDAVVPALALCSTHAYNIGEIHNPKEASGKQLMDSVIAMKTTVITQQLYKQYQQLESMLARFKTQLEKAVLTSTMEAAGAKSDDDDGGSYRSNDKYIVLSGASNCLQVWSNGKDAALDCLGRNIQAVIMAINAGNATDARKQLIQDIQGMELILTEGDKKPTLGTECKDIKDGKEKNKQNVLKCAYELNGRIVDAKEARAKEAEDRNRPIWGGR